MTTKNKQFKDRYRSRLEKSLVVVLFLLIVFFQSFPKWNWNDEPTQPEKVQFQFHVDQVPMTEQKVRRGSRPPKKPVIPIESEDPDVPENMTIDETDVYLDYGESIFGNASITEGRPDTIPARPIIQVLPNYPKDLREQGISGTVKLWVLVDTTGKVVDAVVSENDTESKACAEAAIKAARKSTYHAAKADGKPIQMWTRCIYRFEP